MKKPVFYTEIAYFLGIALLSLGTALTEYGGFGISMVVAPAYLLHLKICQTLPFFTFGVAEYTLQAVVLLAMILLLRKVKLPYFLWCRSTLRYSAGRRYAAYRPASENAASTGANLHIGCHPLLCRHRTAVFHISAPGSL